MAIREPSLQGLDAAQVEQARLRAGFNELPARGRRTAARILLEVVREPMFLMLLLAGGVYLLLGDATDAAMLLGFVFITMGITIVQERRTERALEALKDLSSPRALVIREGRQLRIPGREVVPGDLLVLEEGDRVAADAALVASHGLRIDESLLTGESVPVEKATGDAEPATVFSGSMVVQGSGLASVTATGGRTALGAIGKALRDGHLEKSRLQLEIAGLVKRFAATAVGLSLFVLLTFGWIKRDWLHGLLAGITLAMSILPEEFTVILTVFMALGAWRIARHQVLTRHTPVIEALGSATVLCVDKTGTLTQNRMAVRTVQADGAASTLAESGAADGPCQLAPELAVIVEHAVLASELLPFDPMEQAFHACLAQHAPQLKRDRWSLVQEYPLTPQLAAMTHVWQVPGRQECVVAAKGAPEAVAALCGLDPARREAVLRQVERLAAQGQRVLAVARAECQAPGPGLSWPEQPEQFGFAWLGLIGLADPLRLEVPDAIAECRQAGIRVAMITGDYPATAQAIGRQAGLRHERVLTGTELNAMSDAELGAIIGQVDIFARILPQQKLRLVNACKAGGEVVAMTGDGVNDVPALKAAHIGIAMGKRGTDVAREAASLVLLNDDFGSIVRAIALGRRIYDNLRKALIYVVAVHTPIVAMSLLALLFGAELVFFPIHIVFLEMIINPACAIVFESEQPDRDIMRRPPRAEEERLFGARTLGLALLQGCGLSVVAAAAYLGGLASGSSADQARALAFLCVVIGNLALIVVNRSFSESVLVLLRIPNPAQWWMVGGTLAALFAVLSVPVLRQVFHFQAVGAMHLQLVLVTSLLAVLWFEALKRLYFPGPRQGR